MLPEYALQNRRAQAR